MDNKTFISKINTIKKQMYMIALSMLRNHEDAEDVVQEAILSAYETSWKLKNEDSFNAWMFRIIINQAKMFIRKNHRLIVTNEIPDQIHEEKYEDVWDVVLALNKELSTVVILYYVQEYSVKEIAKIMTIPVGTVKTRVAKARELLREELKKYE